MSVQELVMQLPRIEKIRLMESLWTDLSGHGEEIDSPQWHEGLLRQTEQRVAEGVEESLDWDEAKRRIRGS
jgi:hypothetical protein